MSKRFFSFFLALILFLTALGTANAFYDPSTGRFLTEDTYLGDPGTPPSLHRYLYAYSNPTVYVDLEGYESVTTDKNGNVYWQVERDLPGPYNPSVGKPYLIGKKDNAGRVEITKEFGGGTVDYSSINELADKFWYRGDTGSIMNPKDISGQKIDRQKGIIRENLDKYLNPHNEDRIYSEIPTIRTTADKILDPLQKGMDWASNVPALSTLLSAANSGVYALRGKYGDAAIAGVAVVPGVVQAKRLKSAGKLLKNAEEVAHDLLVLEKGIEKSGLQATKITEKGIERIERHLTQTPGIEPGAAEFKMIERLRSGQHTPEDLRFYQHEIIESRIINKTRNLHVDPVDAARDAHHRTLIKQDLYRPGYIDKLYHPDALKLME